MHTNKMYMAKSCNTIDVEIFLTEKSTIISTK